MAASLQVQQTEDKGYFRAHVTSSLANWDKEYEDMENKE